ncbi:hypothetical protein NCCP1664_05440 [Zafaria cholistanensis]|uniref:SURF1-like protein n=1 Tax=Zafaria cholistanensis TaxID=1682741 RepID=A0A5A7NPW0_9MICC|nr:SURF1 family protein [Zafaria cholistanensis]GER22047.1 hypothetical protein NCCP1664_05440 [Zafaria cholistanensis]
MYRFLASTRWLGWFLLACVFAAACYGLGNWQMSRLDSARAENHRVATNYDAAPLAFGEARPLFSALPEDRKWARVALRGEYLARDTVVVRNRPVGGAPGYEVLVPFRTVSGETVVVNRGWLPIGNESAGRPDAIPSPPSGTVDVLVRLKPGEPNLERSAPEGQLATINLETYAAKLPYPIATGAYGIMSAEDPAPDVAPTPLERPELEEGNHLSYAFQWFAFGVLAFVGLGYAARLQARINREDREATAEAAASGTAVLHSAYRAPRRPARRGGKPTDEDAEDAYLDALEAAGRPPQGPAAGN